MTNGFFKLQRRFFDHWLWLERRSFSKAEAWLDLLQIAAFTPTKRIVRDKLLQIEEGEVIASLRFLAERWTWNKDKVGQFLSVLEAEKMIRRQTRQGETVITLTRYKDYAKSPDTSPDGDPDKGQTGGRQKPDKYKEGEERVKGKENTPQPPKGGSAKNLSDFDETDSPPPLCTLDQALEAGRSEKISDKAVTYWWHARNSAGWTKGVAGGGVARKVSNWRSDLSNSRRWAEEESHKPGNSGPSKRTTADSYGI